MRATLRFLVASLITCVLAQASLIPGMEPGKARVSSEGEAVRLTNRVLSALVTPQGITLKNKITDEMVSLPIEDGAPPKIQRLSARRDASKVADQVTGLALTEQSSHQGVIRTTRVILTDDANYLRIVTTLLAQDTPDPSLGRNLKPIVVSLPGAQVVGSVPGSPIVSSSLFLCAENPLSRSKVLNGLAEITIERKVSMTAHVPLTYSAVIGVSPKGQMRRAFLNYLERERAHPYRPFLHYNSWYDIGYFSTYSEKDCLDSIDGFGRELVKARGVKMDSFLFDDGWDDHKTVWEFHKGLPTGFLSVKKEAGKYGAAPGVWLSPWGGYGPPRDQRLATGKAAGMEIDKEGYALSGPNYYKRFHQVCLDLVGKYGINQFKLDGTGDPDKQYPGSAFGSDFEAAIQLIQDLREAKPSLFINLTTGTWPSPLWLRTADSIWRGGEDHSFAGVGTKRQQWITYRDGDVFHGVVQQGPLYPLNSLMLHGLIYAQYAHDLDKDPGNDFADEVHDYFGNGTQLQEMYITHKLLSKQNWNDLAEAAKWSRTNADTLVDTHWIGGDPTKLECYGWASWSPRKGILVLRNPSDKPQTFSLDLAKAFELPTESATHYRLKSPWKADTVTLPLFLVAGEAHIFGMKPFQVLVLDATPER